MSAPGPSTPAKTPRARSRLDDWDGWPENCSTFDPIHGHIQAKRVREKFCLDNKCEGCTRPDVVQMIEYDDEGTCLEDATFSPSELEDYLRKVEINSKRARFQIFILRAHLALRCIRYPYARQILSFCQAPVDVAHAFGNSEERLSSGSFLQTASAEIGGHNLHYWLAFSHTMRLEDLLPQDFLLPSISISQTPAISTALYVAHDYASGSYTIVIGATTNTIVSLQEGVKAGIAKEDPFVLAVWHIGSLLRNLQLDVEARLRYIWMVDMKRSLDAEEYLQLHGALSGSLLYATELRSIVTRLNLAVGDFRARHTLYAQQYGTSLAARDFVNTSFEAQQAALYHLTEDCKMYRDFTQVQIDAIARASDLKNSGNMHNMMRDNQKQTEATEALARESKRDSEVMKTITVVTLVYLPATFTLLSMGLFDFNVGESGSLRVARQGWIFLAIALPLTIITLGLAYGWQRRKEKEATAAAAAKKAVERAADEEHAAESDGAIPPQIGAVPASGDAAIRTTSSRNWMRMLPLRRRKASPGTGIP
ncbi:hypothetical protein EXIGLDRAFT_767521 [Exidia glandulosa HHB12029]|uniref:Cora-domain-containing protein n=1 Tax=Exidia glandulosa HHB12029 TaxID=1314781 RepID=A0A165IWI9_EXIGL|nr:hypothetical protein EXIGLDRAFT_767521 [Exidia glandulosa HHB12029]